MFKPNDVVLCIDAKKLKPELPQYTELKEGKHYTVLHTCRCCTGRISVKEIPTSDVTPAGKTCILCPADDIFGYFNWRFIKLAGSDIDVNIEEKKECSNFSNQKTVLKTGLKNVLKRIKEKVLP